VWRTSLGMNSRRPPGEAQALRWVVARLPCSTGRRRESNIDRREPDGATAGLLALWERWLIGQGILVVEPDTDTKAFHLSLYEPE
jgi:hypothetical protein